MSIEALRALISAPPYDAMTDEACAAALNAPTVPVQGDVTKSRYILWLAANNGFSIIEQAKGFEHPVPQIQAGVRAAGTAAAAILNAADVPVIATGDPQVAQLFGLFQQVGLLSAAAVESFMAYGRIMKTPAEMAGLGAPSFADVLEARKHAG
jgi:hypothetical protein